MSRPTLHGILAVDDWLSFSHLECSNCITIALIGHLIKVLMLMLTERLRGPTEEYINQSNHWFNVQTFIGEDDSDAQKKQTSR